MKPKSQLERPWSVQAGRYPTLASRIDWMGRHDVAETLDTLGETFAALGPSRARKVVDAWLAWYPEYVSTVVSEIVASSGSDQDRARLARSQVLAQSRLIESACSVLVAVERRGVVRREHLRRLVGGISMRQLDGAIILLARAGAIRVTDVGVMACGCPTHVRVWLFENRSELFDSVDGDLVPSAGWNGVGAVDPVRWWRARDDGARWVSRPGQEAAEA